MTDYTPYFISGIFLIGGGLVGGFFLLRNRRRQELIPVPPTWPEILAKFESQDKKIAALGRLLASAAEQWPSDRPGPIFDDRDLMVVDEDTMPANWRRTPRRPRTAPQG